MITRGERVDFTGIALFAGGGGLELGLRRLLPASRIVAYVEREAYACHVLATRMEEGRLAPAPIWTDVSTFDGRPYGGLVDFVAGGFPCQDVSNAGKRAGIKGARSGLWKQFKRVVSEVQPRLVFVENVAALRSRGLDVVLEDLAALGFDAEWGTFRASDVGAPHRRDRLFLVAYRVGSVVRDESGRCCGACGAGASELADPRQTVAHHHPHGRQGLGRGGVLDGEREALRDYLDRRCCAPMAHGHGHGHGHGLEDYLASGSAEGATSGRPMEWPPGPEDFEAWARVLAERPDLAPSQCGVRPVANGFSTWMDELRMLGNGVVPAQAAEAYRQLLARLTSKG